MHIIEYNNYTITPTQEAFLIKPIRDLFNKDKSKNKENFMKQMSIMYFLVDPRSSYSYIIDEEERLKEILLQEGLPKDYKISEDLKKAMDIYQKHTVTSSSALLQDTKIVIGKLRQFFRDVDLNALDDKGKPIYTVSAITKAIKDVPELAKDIIAAEKVVAQEIEEQGRARGGNNNKTLFDDGIDI